MVRESANRGRGRRGPRHGPRLQLESRLRERQRLQERRIDIGELQTDLGTYLDEVRKGRTLLLTDGGHPVARLGPVRVARASPPATFDEFLDALNAEWARGIARHDEFERLYGKVEHVALLNRIGGAFFAELQRILWDDLLLGVTRLTDPPGAGRAANLTIQRLPEFCGPVKLPMKELEEQLKAAVEAAEFARSHRNKRISHKDLDHVISPDKLPPATLEHIRKALDAVHAVLQTVNVKYRQTSLGETVTVVEGVNSFLGRAESLVNAVLGVEELLANVSGQAPFWDEDVTRDWIRRLGGEPSAENVRRIINLRVAAKWLRMK